MPLRAHYKPRQSPVFIHSNPASGKPGRSIAGEAERLWTAPWMFS